MRIFRGLWYFFSIGLFGVVLVDYLFAGTFILVDYLALIPQTIYFVFALLLLFSSYFVFRPHFRKIQLLPLITIICICSWLLDSVAFRFPPHSVSNDPLRVFSWNTLLWDARREDAFFEQIKKLDADVILLQEVFYSRAPGVDSRIQKAFPDYTLTHYDQFVTLSRYPVRLSERAHFEGYSKTVIEYQGKFVSLYNVHLQIPLFEKQMGRDNFFNIRKIQFSELVHALSLERGAFFVAGDFNTLRNYPFISLLESRYTVNHPFGLFVLPATFSSRVPGIRIDYQITNKESVFVRYDGVRNSLSDHIGIYGEVVLQ